MLMKDLPYPYVWCHRRSQSSHAVVTDTRSSGGWIGNLATHRTSQSSLSTLVQDISAMQVAIVNVCLVSDNNFEDSVAQEICSGSWCSGRFLYFLHYQNQVNLYQFNSYSIFTDCNILLTPSSEESEVTHLISAVTENYSRTYFWLHNCKSWLRYSP